MSHLDKVIHRNGGGEGFGYVESWLDSYEWTVPGIESAVDSAIRYCRYHGIEPNRLRLSDRLHTYLVNARRQRQWKHVVGPEEALQIPLGEVFTLPAAIAPYVRPSAFQVGRWEEAK